MIWPMDLNNLSGEDKKVFEGALENLFAFVGESIPSFMVRTASATGLPVPLVALCLYTMMRDMINTNMEMSEVSGVNPQVVRYFHGFYSRMEAKDIEILGPFYQEPENPTVH